MSKSFISIIVFLVLLVIFINGFSASYTSRQLGNLAYVLAMGIDVGENSKMKVSVQFTKTNSVSSSSSSSSEDSSNVVLVSGEADSIFSAINLLNSYIGKEINLSHCSILVFSEDFARNGISTEIYSLMNNEEVRPTTNLVISKCDAYDYLSNSNPNIEKLTTQYYETFSITGRFTGYFSHVTIGEFFNSLSEKSSGSTAILGGLNATARKENSNNKSDNSSKDDSSNSTNSSELGENENVVINPENLIAGNSSVTGKRGTENFGLAVFNNDVLCGELTAVESICHLLIVNELDSCIISIDNPLLEDEAEKMELLIFPTKKSKINVDIKDDIPHISLKLSLDADIMTINNNIDYEDENVLLKISDSLNKYLKTQLTNYLTKVSKEYGVDIDSFSTKALSHFSTIPVWESFDCNNKFKEAIFDVSTDVNVLSTMLITKT